MEPTKACNVRENVVWSAPGHQPDGNDPFQAVASLLICNSTEEPSVGHRPSCGMQQMSMNTYILILYLSPAAAAAFCFTLAVSVSMICETPEGSSTTFVPSHLALSVNSVHSSLMSMSLNLGSEVMLLQALSTSIFLSLFRLGETRPSAHDHRRVLTSALLQERDRTCLALRGRIIVPGTIHHKG